VRVTRRERTPTHGPMPQAFSGGHSLHGGRRNRLMAGPDCLPQTNNVLALIRHAYCSLHGHVCINELTAFLVAAVTRPDVIIRRSFVDQPPPHPRVSCHAHSLPSLRFACSSVGHRDELERTSPSGEPRTLHVVDLRSGPAIRLTLPRASIAVKPSHQETLGYSRVDHSDAHLRERLFGVKRVEALEVSARDVPRWDGYRLGSGERSTRHAHARRATQGVFEVGIVQRTKRLHPRLHVPGGRRRRLRLRPSPPPRRSPAPLKLADDLSPILPERLDRSALQLLLPKGVHLASHDLTLRRDRLPQPVAPWPPPASAPRWPAMLHREPK